MPRSKRRLAGLAAAILLSLCATSARAAVTVNEQHFRAVWTAMELEFIGQGAIHCPVTLEGSFHSATFSPSRGLPVADLTSAAVGTCTGGSLTFLTELLPWSVNWVDSNSTSFHTTFANLSWRISIGGRTCLSRATTEEPARDTWIVERAGAVAIQTDETINLPLSCPELRLRYSGQTAVTRAGSTNPLVIRGL